MLKWISSSLRTQSRFFLTTGFSWLIFPTEELRENSSQVTVLFQFQVHISPWTRDISLKYRHWHNRTVSNMETQARLLTSSRSVVLDRNPSCVEFCPAYPEIFLVGTYNLEESEQESVHQGASKVENAENGVDQKTGNRETSVQTRNGTLVVFKIEARYLV